MGRAIVLAAGWLIFACHAVAAGGPSKKQCSQAALFVAETNMDLLLAGLKGAVYSGADQESALAKFDASKASAVKAVASTSTYQNAMKDYVAAASGFFRGISSEAGESPLVYQARTASLKSRLQEAQERVQLEEELACGK